MPRKLQCNTKTICARVRLGLQDQGSFSIRAPGMGPEGHTLLFFPEQKHEEERSWSSATGVGNAIPIASPSSAGYKHCGAGHLMVARRGKRRPR